MMSAARAHPTPHLSHYRRQDLLRWWETVRDPLGVFREVRHRRVRRRREMEDEDECAATWEDLVRAWEDCRYPR